MEISQGKGIIVPILNHFNDGASIVEEIVSVLDIMTTDLTREQNSSICKVKTAIPLERVSILNNLQPSPTYIVLRLSHLSL